MVLNTIIAAIEPFYKSLPGSNVLYFLYSWGFVPLFLVSLFKAFIFFLLRTCVGLVLSSIGVVWNETLSTIPRLNLLAEDILEKFGNLTNVRVPGIPYSYNMLPAQSNDQNSKFFSFLGLIILSILGFIFCVGLVDYYAPEVVKDTPVIGTVADNNQSAWDILKSWWPGNTPDPEPTLHGQNQCLLQTPEEVMEVVEV